MTVLVVGGAGYIGSHQVDLLVSSGYDVCVVDNLSTGHRNAIKQAVRFYQGDIRDKIFLNEVFKKEKIDAVLHFAANSLVGESMEKPLVYFNNNIYGTQVLLEVMESYRVDKIIFSSSAATYGEPVELPLLETSLTKPTNPYGETKLIMEKMMKWCEQAYGLQYVALRYFNVGGAKADGSIGEDHSPETHLIPVILQTLLGQRDHLTIYGHDYPTEDGTCVRDYVHISDLCQAHMLALEYLVNGGKSDVFNLGSNHGFSVLQMVEATERITGLNVPICYGERRAGDPAVLVASAEKAKTILRWCPQQTNLEAIISSAWKWHQRYPNGYK